MTNDKTTETEARCFDSWLDSYLKYTSNQESPSMFHLWTGVAVIAGALNRNVWLNRGYRKLYPNLFTVLVAPTGRGRKTTAADIGLELLRQIDGINILHEKVTPEGLIEFLKTKAKIIKNETKFAEENTAFVYAPELSVFLGNQSYVSGLIELLTSLYDGKDIWEYTTRTKGQLVLNNVNVNIFGASNPEWLAKGFKEDSFGGGFMGRTIFVFNTDKQKKIAWPSLSKEQETLKLLLSTDLHKISKLKGEFKVTKEAHDYYEDWYNKYEGDFTGRLAGYMERKPNHILKLAMVWSANFDDEMVIEKDFIVASIKMLDDLETRMPEAFAYINATNEAQIAQKVIDMMAENNGTVSRVQAISTIRHMIKSVRDFDAIMETLAESGIIIGYVKDKERMYVLKEMFDSIIKNAAEETEETEEKKEEAG